MPVRSGAAPAMAIGGGCLERLPHQYPSGDLTLTCSVNDFQSLFNTNVAKKAVAEVAPPHREMVASPSLYFDSNRELMSTAVHGLSTYLRV